MRDLLEHRRLVVTITLLYLSQGIPIGVAMDAMPALLRHDGASLHALAFLPLVGLPWVVKFLWAPFVDNRWSARVGRRRSWMLPMQGIVVLCLAILAQVGMTVSTAGWAVGLLAVASLASATQDIANDGMAAEHFHGEALAKINAIQIASVMIGFFGGGAGLLTLIGLFGQQAAFLVLTAVPLASLACVLWLLPREADRARAKSGPRASLARFARRPWSLSLLSLALLSAMTAVSGFGLSKLFLNDAGWTLAAIGRLGMAGGVVTVVLGCGGGAWLVRRLGLWRAFTAGVGCAGAGALLWFAQANGWLPTAPQWVWLCTVLGSLSTGVTSVSIMTAGMRFAGDGDQAGTDVTAVQSTRDLGELIASSMMLTLTAKVGYTGGFLTGVALAALAALIALRLRRQAPARAGSAGDALA
ncbi:RhtX/FptX family siderophore transporter [Burkholderia sp. F1]|uniref:RhtX/FptX family siderophore transporter n=1 Tax=Burkholderia sp. F1 TaxID=3366817 RepID=UPI003D709037